MFPFNTRTPSCTLIHEARPSVALSLFAAPLLCSPTTLSFAQPPPPPAHLGTGPGRAAAPANWHEDAAAATPNAAPASAQLATARTERQGRVQRPDSWGVGCAAAAAAAPDYLRRLSHPLQCPTSTCPTAAAQIHSAEAAERASEHSGPWQQRQPSAHLSSQDLLGHNKVALPGGWPRATHSG